MFGMIEGEMWGEVVVVDEGVCHFDAFCFHRVLFSELVRCYVFVVEVADLA